MNIIFHRCRATKSTLVKEKKMTTPVQSMQLADPHDPLLDKIILKADIPVPFMHIPNIHIALSIRNVEQTLLYLFPGNALLKAVIDALLKLVGGTSDGSQPTTPAHTQNAVDAILYRNIFEWGPYTITVDTLLEALATQFPGCGTLIDNVIQALLDLFGSATANNPHPAPVAAGETNCRLVRHGSGDRADFFN